MPQKTQSPILGQDNGKGPKSSRGPTNGTHEDNDDLDVLDVLDDLDGPDGPIPPDGDPEYDLRISRDKITVLLDCPDPHSELSTHVTRIVADFQDLEIPEYPDTDQMTSILTDSCSPGENLWNHVIIMGVKPVPSIDARLDWTRDFFARGWKIDEITQSIDFWQKLEDRSVSEDDLLVTLHQPIPGEPGLNVFGNDIPVEKPKKIKLRCGKGVRTEEHEGRVEYFATINGRIRFADGTVAVDDVYAIKGNVGLETGNINHTGSVIIDGDIEAGASVEAEGDILVKGMAETCTIRCGGSLTVVGGILGSEEYRIHIKGNLNAKYISEAIIFVDGNVIAGNEIAHSEIRSLGRVTVEKGRIAGGVIMARHGIKVAEAGAGGAVITHLAAGVDYTLREKENFFTQKLTGLEDAKQKITDAITKVKAGPESQTPKGRQAVAGLSKKMEKVNSAIGQIFTALDDLNRKAEAEAVEELIILEKIWSGTLVQLGNAKLSVKNSIHKPRIAQRKRTRVRLFPLGDGNMPED